MANSKIREIWISVVNEYLDELFKGVKPDSETAFTIEDLRSVLFNCCMGVFIKFNDR